MVTPAPKKVSTMYGDVGATKQVFDTLLRASTLPDINTEDADPTGFKQKFNAGIAAGQQMIKASDRNRNSAGKPLPITVQDNEFKKKKQTVKYNTMDDSQ